MLGSFGSALTGGLSTLVDAGVSLYNQKSANDTNKSIASDNLDFQRENLQYQKDLQQQIFDREDNAVQRRVADLVAAGLSPTLAAGSSADAGSVVETKALNNDYKQIPYQVDVKGILGSALDTMSAIGELNKQRAEISYLQNQSDNVKADTANKLIFGESAGTWYDLRNQNMARQNYGLDLKNKAQGFNNEILEKTKENQIKALEYKTSLLNNELWWSNFDRDVYGSYGFNPKYANNPWNLMFSGSVRSGHLLDALSENMKKGFQNSVDSVKRSIPIFKEKMKNDGKKAMSGASNFAKSAGDTLGDLLYTFLFDADAWERTKGHRIKK